MMGIYILTIWAIGMLVFWLIYLNAAKEIVRELLKNNMFKGMPEHTLQLAIAMAAFIVAFTWPISVPFLFARKIVRLRKGTDDHP